MYDFSVPHTFERSVVIEAPVGRVWRALTEPREVVAWDTGLGDPLDAPPDYPQPGQHVRWRYRLGPLPLLLHDRPQEVSEGRLLRSLIAIGPVRIDETYTLSAAGMGTRLTASLSVRTALPVIGPLVERLFVARQSEATVEQSLAAIKRHCETRP